MAHWYVPNSYRVVLELIYRIVKKMSDENLKCEELFTDEIMFKTVTNVLCSTERR